MNSAAHFYSRPSYVGGIHFPVYAGSRRQTGGSGVFGSLKRSIVPALKDVGKDIGREALGLAADVANDVIQGKEFNESIKQRAKERVKSAAATGLQTLTKRASNALNGKRKYTYNESYLPTKRRRKYGQGYDNDDEDEEMYSDHEDDNLVQKDNIMNSIASNLADNALDDGGKVLINLLKAAVKKKRQPTAAARKRTTRKTKVSRRPQRKVKNVTHVILLHISQFMKC